MRRTLAAASLVVGLLAPVAASAAPLAEAPEQTPGPLPLIDSDRNGLTDGLEALLEAAAPNDRIDIVAIFADESTAGQSQQSLPDQALR